MLGTRSTLIVPVPAAEPAVSVWRWRYDPDASAGVPAHITVLYPFLHPVHVTEQVLQMLRDLFAKHQAFPFALRRLGTFPRVLFLAPDPTARFIALTETVHRQWPDYPPYEGAFDEVVPHLTLGRDMPQDQERLAAAALQQVLPIVGRARHVELLVEHQDKWRPAARFPLGG